MNGRKLFMLRREIEFLGKSQRMISRDLAISSHQLNHDEPQSANVMELSYMLKPPFNNKKHCY